MDIASLILVVVLIALTAFFVGAEFAIVKIRPSRVEQLVLEKRTGALAVKKVTTNLDEYLSACQLGITVTALGLGWIGEKTIYNIIHPLFLSIEIGDSVAKVVSFAIAFSTITFFHVVLGELAPKTIAIQKAEAISLAFAPILVWFYRLAFPIIWILNGSARFFTRLFGFKGVSEHEEGAHSEDELRIILSESYESGEINQAEYKYVNRIFEFDERIAKEIMVPRTEMVGFYLDNKLSDHLETIRQEKYTRYPVFGEDKDDVIGMINVKDYFINRLGEKPTSLEDLRDYMRPVLKVMETIPVHDLLLRMQRERIQMAILFDEYGGTAGLVTLEDIVEEIVGEIRDEYDGDEQPPIQEINENHKIVDGKVLVSDINRIIDVDIDDDEIDTIGGWMLAQSHSQRLRNGFSVRVGGYSFTILKVDNNHVERVEIKRIENIHSAQIM
ncbi:MAG: hemolysin family protein [Bacillaceae bacterium]